MKRGRRMIGGACALAGLVGVLPRPVTAAPAKADERAQDVADVEGAAPDAEPTDNEGEAAGEPTDETEPTDASAADADPDDDDDEAEPEAETDEGDAPAPGRSVWATDDEPAPKPAAEPRSDGPIGGYLDSHETKELAPATGERKLLAAYILLPLGTLATVTGAISTWATQPDHCQERLGSLASSISADDCPGLYALNIVRTTYGSLMIVSGAVLLGVGLRDRNRYREWKSHHGARLVPYFGRSGGGLSWSLRF